MLFGERKKVLSCEPAPSVNTDFSSRPHYYWARSFGHTAFLGAKYGRVYFASRTIIFLTCMTMKLDLTQITTKEALMTWLKDSFHFPEYFGANWDAVAECLPDACTADVAIEVVNESAATDEMKLEMAILRNVIEEFNVPGGVRITVV